MAGRGLNDTEVASEMKKMVEFIKQEANEKAREIQVKAEEEHNIEKAKIVRQETLAIEALYEKKMKQAKVAWRIAQSNHINKSRLGVLQTRQEKLNEVFAEAKSQLASIPADTTKYSALILSLLEQGIQQLKETSILVECRSQDQKLVESQAKVVKKSFEAKNKKVELKVAGTLPDSTGGGVKLSALEGRIVCNNSLEARLYLAEEKLLPAIRAILLGIPKTRRFFD